MLRSLLNLALQSLSMAYRPGEGLVLKGTIDEVRQAAHRRWRWPVSGVEIIGYKKPADPSCAFIAELPSLRFVRLFAAHLEDMQAVQRLPYLRHVTISHVAKGQIIPLDFSVLPSLERAELEWFEGAETIFQSRTIRSLALKHYPSSSSEIFRNLRNLSVLRLSAGRLKEIEAIQQLQALKWLALIGQEQLANFDGLSLHPSLQFLWIEACQKLGTLRWVADIRGLQTLRILDCGTITGIEAVQSLSRLRHIHIHGSVDVSADDLTFLRNFSDIQSVVIRGMSKGDAEYWEKHSKRYDLLRSDIRGDL